MTATIIGACTVAAFLALDIILNVKIVRTSREFKKQLKKPEFRKLSISRAGDSIKYDVTLEHKIDDKVVKVKPYQINNPEDLIFV